MVVARDVSEIRVLQKSAMDQEEKLRMIGELVNVKAEKFQNFRDDTLNLLRENRKLLKSKYIDTEVIDILFRNMHTIKGSARTYDLSFCVDQIHKAEQLYEDTRSKKCRWDAKKMLI